MKKNEIFTYNINAQKWNSEKMMQVIDLTIIDCIESGILFM